jgi:hypothetical protein
MSAVTDCEGWTNEVALVHALVRRAICCPCPHPTRIAIRYGRDTDSERLANELLEQLRIRRHDILVHMQSDDDHRPQRSRAHSCVVVDALDGTMT